MVPVSHVKGTSDCSCLRQPLTSTVVAAPTLARRPVHAVNRACSAASASCPVSSGAPPDAEFVERVHVDVTAPLYWQCTTSEERQACAAVQPGVVDCGIALQSQCSCTYAPTTRLVSAGIYS